MQPLPVIIRRSARELWADSRTNCAAYGGGMCNLHEELRRCQQRLGTAAEQADDFDRARSLAHQINNQLQMAYLTAVIGASVSLDDRRRVA